jgi:hypothetical protein
MALSCGYKCLQVLLIIMNILLLLFSIALIVVGSIAEANLEKYGGKDMNNLRGFVIFVIVLGCYLFVVGIFGFCGACKKSVYCLTIYCILVGIFILAGIAGGIAGFVLKDKVKSSVNEVITEMFNRYSSDKSYKKIIDRVQKDLKCCGPDGTWPTSQGTMPDSCSENGVQHTAGCIDEIQKFFKKYILIVALCIFLFALVEILGIVFGVCVINAIKNEGTA